MIRTWDPQIRNLVLYPAELPGLVVCGSVYREAVVQAIATRSLQVALAATS